MRSCAPRIYADPIGTEIMSPRQYRQLLVDPCLDDRLAEGLTCVVVDGSDDLPPVGSLPIVVLATRPCAGADSVVDAADLDGVLARVAMWPIAAVSLCLLLRSQDGIGFEDGLAMESAVYSSLQSGPEFAAWRAAAPHVPDTDSGPRVRVERIDDELIVTLDRPHRHNAIDARLRDELVDALRVAVADRSLRVVLQGAGPSFSSGGDLGEFGERPDPATAHMVRLTRSPARSLARLSERSTARLHGVAMGGGIEMAAFAGTVVADPDTRIALPELALGLVPGAGGTVSLPRRIGRRRTAWLALTGREIDATTAHAWGLVDRLEIARN